MIGKQDIFEREYMEKFRLFASKYGEFVKYEYDRGARDIGLHFTQTLSNGNAVLTSSLCWFQMKGIMTNTLPVSVYNTKSEITLSLQTSHLRYWYLQPSPTYLVVYIQAIDRFLIMNIQKYIEEIWGKTILSREEDTATVKIPTNSILDEQAFSLILKEGRIAEWKRITETEHNTINICHRDFNIIWHLGTASERKKVHRLVYWDWQSKNRSQIYIQEKSPKDKDWTDIREHLEYMGHLSELENTYPYLELYNNQIPDDDEFIIEDEDEYVAKYLLKNGTEIPGIDCSGEFIKYEFGISLNEYGKVLNEYVSILIRCGLIKVDELVGDSISIAPWHYRKI